jgi:EmrB/QacA subfamily drug resistance transporter
VSQPSPSPSPSPAGASAGPPAPLPHRDVLIVFSGLMLGMLLAALDQTIVATALPTIAGDLGGLNHLSWVVTAYLLTSTAATPLYGKVSDLYGRRLVFQVAIVIFLAGSALSGASQNLGQLVAFRAVQGLGGGGLMAIAMAIVGDVVAPRDRGRYQGYFGSVFALASVMGPLLGGLFTDHLSWRWIFYINLPIGAVALAVTSSVLRMRPAPVRHRVDYLGSALLAAWVTTFLLITVWGGSTYPWGSPVIVLLGLATAVLVGAFLLREKVAAEPILPLRLFRNRTFSVGSGMILLIGLAMFGAVIYIPEYLQVVKGDSATTSGLLLIPVTIGIVVTSTASGQVISRTGRYKAFPVAGSATFTVGFWLLSHLGAHTPTWQSSLSMLVIGLGIGMVMQVIVLAVQNAVPYPDLGTATAALTFGRTIGGAFGTALFGAILTNRLAHYIPLLLPGPVASRFSAGRVTGSPAALRQLPPGVHQGLVAAFVHGFHAVFLYAVPFAGLCFLAALALPERPLRQAPAARGHQAAGQPVAASVAPAAD